MEKQYEYREGKAFHAGIEITDPSELERANQQYDEIFGEFYPTSEPIRQKEEIMRVTYAPEGINNFHGMPGINLVISGKKETDPMSDSGREVWIISESQKRRIEKHFCGISDCHCPAGAIVELSPDGSIYGLRQEWTERR